MMRSSSIKRRARAVARIGACAALAACAGTAVTREVFVPIPEHPARPNARDDLRGSETAARRISTAQQYEIMAEVVRRFYRPMMAQARWIDPQPLAHRRTRTADSLVAADPDRAIAIVDAAALKRVCPLNEANEQCRGLRGGVLRFSAAYAVGSATQASPDSAIVYARYTPVDYGVASEIEFFVTRDASDGPWRIVSRRTMPDVPAAAAGGTDTESMVADLIEADRAFAAAAKQSNLVTALSNMFVSNVVMQAPGGHVHGKEGAIASLNTNPENARSRVTWNPVKGGVSSDGQNGFTVGYMTITRPDGTIVPAKYVAYWVMGDGGWKVAAYKRVPRPAGEPVTTMLPPSLPIRGLPRGDTATVRRYADELSAAERAFSRDATPMGLGPAFEKWGAEDAVNAGGPAHAEFVRGPQAIAKVVGAGLPPGSEISWGPSEVIVSTTGDLGVSIGTIRFGGAAAAGAPGGTREVPFFTIWKRATPSAPWRYVAE